MEKKEINWKGKVFYYFAPEVYSGEKLPEIDFQVQLPIILGSTTNRTLAEVSGNAIVIGLRLLDEDKLLLKEACTKYNKILLDGMGNPYNP